MSKARKRWITRRRRTNHVSPASVFTRGGLVTLGVATLVYLATSLYNGVPGRAYSSVKATLPEVGNLIEHDPVRMAGVRIGQVKRVSASSDGKAHLDLQLNPSVKLPDDSRIVIRANGLLGARFVQITGGQSRTMIADGGSVRPDAAQSLTYGVPEALDTFNAETRGQLRNTVAGLGTGLMGRGEDLNVFFRRVSDEVTHAQDLFTTLTATGAVPGLLPSLRSGLQPLNDDRVNLTAMMPATSQALQPFVTERGAVRAILDAAPPALDAADVGLAKGTRLLTSVRQVATAVQRTLPLAPRGLATTSRLLSESGIPLKRTEALLTQAEPTVPKLLDITGALRPVLSPLTALSNDLDPMVALLGKYGCDVVNLGTVFRSMTGSGGNGSGPNGPLKEFRLQAISPSQSEVTSVDATKDPLFVPDPAPAPCKYLSKPYPGTVTKVPQG